MSSVPSSLAQAAHGPAAFDAALAEPLGAALAATARFVREAGDIGDTAGRVLDQLAGDPSGAARSVLLAIDWVQRADAAAHPPAAPGLVPPDPARGEEDVELAGAIQLVDARCAAAHLAAAAQAAAAAGQTPPPSPSQVVRGLRAELAQRGLARPTRQRVMREIAAALGDALHAAYACIAPEPELAARMAPAQRTQPGIRMMSRLFEHFDRQPGLSPEARVVLQRLHDCGRAIAARDATLWLGPDGLTAARRIIEHLAYIESPRIREARDLTLLVDEQLDARPGGLAHEDG